MMSPIWIAFLLAITAVPPMVRRKERSRTAAWNDTEGEMRADMRDDVKDDRGSAVQEYV
jgi:hypothetical protein